jgi:hypothetical protein
MTQRITVEGMKKLSADPSSPSTSLITRTLDVVDRSHARLAMRLHDVRNDVLDSVKRGIERAEAISAQLIARARAGVDRADHVSADAVNRAQGAVGRAIERARVARATPAHA